MNPPQHHCTSYRNNPFKTMPVPEFVLDFSLVPNILPQNVHSLQT